MAIAFVTGQKAQTQTAVAAATFPVALPAGATAGNLLVLGVTYFGGTPAATVVTDDKGNTWAQAGIWRQTSGHGFAGIFYAANVIAATQTVTVHYSSNFTEVTLCAAEFSGVDTASPLDGTNGAIGAGRTPNSGTITPTAANELFLFLVTPDASTTIATVTSWTNLGKEQSTSSFQEMGFDFFINPGTTALGVSQTNLLGTSTNWACTIAAFKVASGGTPGSVTLTGASSTSSASVGSETGAAAQTLTGASSTSSAGTVVAGVSGSVTITGASTSLSASVGSETGGGANTLTGAASTSSAGTTTESGASSTSLVGSSATSSAGTTTESGSSSVPLTGSGVTGTAGATTPSGSSSVLLSGSGASSNAGTASGSGGSSVSLTGTGLTGTAGTTSESGDGLVSVLGVSVSSGAGTVIASSSGPGAVSILGVEVTSAAGSLTPSGAAANAILGLSSSVLAGTVTADAGGVNVFLTGASVTSGAGSLIARGAIVIPMWMYQSPSSFLSDMIGNDVYLPVYKDAAASLLNGRLASTQYQTEHKTIEGFITLWESRDSGYKTIIDGNPPIPPQFTTPN